MCVIIYIQRFTKAALQSSTTQAITTTVVHAAIILHATALIYLMLLVVGSTYRRPACDFLPGAAYVMSMSISMPPNCKHEHMEPQ
jgi:hypothetical protein